MFINYRPVFAFITLAPAAYLVFHAIYYFAFFDYYNVPSVYISFLTSSKLGLTLMLFLVSIIALLLPVVIYLISPKTKRNFVSVAVILASSCLVYLFHVYFNELKLQTPWNIVLPLCLVSLQFLLLWTTIYYIENRSSHSLVKVSLIALISLVTIPYLLGVTSAQKSVYPFMMINGRIQNEIVLDIYNDSYVVLSLDKNHVGSLKLIPLRTKGISLKIEEVDHVFQKK